MDWLKTDLNLLKVLHAVLTEGSVSGAARKLCLTPSAISHQLARLRVNTGDPLFVREGQGMVPTSRAIELSKPLSTIISTLSEPEMAGDQVDLRSIQRSVKIVMPPPLEAVLLPMLCARLNECAPNMDVIVIPFERRDYSRELQQSIVDFVVSVGGTYATEEETQHEVLYSDTLACVIGPKSPLYDLEEFDPEQWLEQPHIYSVPWAIQENYLDQWLARHWRPRRIAVSLNHWGAVPHLVRYSELVATVPTKLAGRLIEAWPELKMQQLPPKIAEGEVFLQSAKIFLKQPALAKIRNLILEIVGEELRSPS